MKHIVPILFVLATATNAYALREDDDYTMALYNLSIPMTWESEYRSPNVSAPAATCERCGASCTDPYADCIGDIEAKALGQPLAVAVAIIE